MTTTTSVVCAVWNKDPNRHALLRGHMESLSQQSTATTPIYVFDNGDNPPDWLKGVAVVSPRPLTIYQAWNVGVQVAETEFVMNLNLDDRLAPDAVALLEDAARANNAGLVGGDWSIRYNQADTDDVAASFPAGALPFNPSWPPPPGCTTILGSGVGNRGTYGPATLWRRGLHAQIPFPWQFGSGAPIRIIGDLAWWAVVERLLRARTVRLPLVIGNYYSHPEDQAEFRSKDEHPKLVAEGIGEEWYPLDRIAITRR